MGSEPQCSQGQVNSACLSESLKPNSGVNPVQENTGLWIEWPGCSRAPTRPQTQTPKMPLGFLQGAIPAIGLEHTLTALWSQRIRAGPQKQKS